MNLSDLERALVLAEETNADGVLQIGTWRWRQTEVGIRYFVEYDEPELIEVTPRDYRTYLREEAPRNSRFNPRRYQTIDDKVLDFTGRLVDVDTGEVMGSFAMTVPVVRLAEPLHLEIDKDNRVVSSNYSFMDSDYVNERETAAVVSLFDRLANLIAGIDTP